jgi:membrane associated rhomboid family serine protease
MGIIDDLKNNFKKGNVLIRLIYINVGVFIILNVINLIVYLIAHDSLKLFFINWLAFPSNFFIFLHKPWTIVSYMFVHSFDDIWHILFNLLWLYWFGQIFLQYLNQKQLLSLYILGGFAGALLYSLAYNLFPAFNFERFGSSMVGASAAIMAIVIAISAIVPNYSLNLLLFGTVKLKYIAIFTIAIDVISIQYSNAGGHIAHLGGALFGYIFAINYNKGKDITSGFSKFLDFIFNIFNRKSRMKVSYKRTTDDKEYNKMKIDQQKEIDRILDKIAKGGYNSLTKEEKDFLFKSSN